MPITPVMLNSGEHVAAVWFNEDKNELQWYLGIASETANANDPLDKILISYLYRSGQSSSIWKFPESAKETETPFGNIKHHIVSLLDMNTYPSSNVSSAIRNWRKLRLLSSNTWNK